MAKSNAKKQRERRIREGRLNPVVKRQTWQRKPLEQVAPNRKRQEKTNRTFDWPYIFRKLLLAMYIIG